MNLVKNLVALDYIVLWRGHLSCSTRKRFSFCFYYLAIYRRFQIHIVITNARCTKVSRVSRLSARRSSPRPTPTAHNHIGIIWYYTSMITASVPYFNLIYLNRTNNAKTWRLRRRQAGLEKEKFDGTYNIA